jgi:hypothetical protein
MIEERYVTRAHGNGGRFAREPISDLFARHLADPQLDTSADAAHVPMPAGDVLITTLLDLPGLRFMQAGPGHANGGSGFYEVETQKCRDTEILCNFWPPSLDTRKKSVNNYPVYFWHRMHWGVGGRGYVVFAGIRSHWAGAVCHELRYPTVTRTSNRRWNRRYRQANSMRDARCSPPQGQSLSGLLSLATSSR